MLEKLGCCPRCILVHNGVKDSEHYASDAAVTIATKALAAGTLTGLLGNNTEQTPLSCDEDNMPKREKDGDDSNLSAPSTDTKDDIPAMDVDCCQAVHSLMITSSSNVFVCVSCLGLLQDECCSQYIIEKVSL